MEKTSAVRPRDQAGVPLPSPFPPLHPDLLPSSCAGGCLHTGDCWPFPGTQLWDCGQQIGTCLASSRLTKLKFLSSWEKRRAHWNLEVSGAKHKTPLGYCITSICQLDPPGPSSSIWWLFIMSMFLLDPRWPGSGSWGQAGQRSLTLNLPT